MTDASARSATPYDDLQPDTVLDALQAGGWSPDGRLLQLNSYENRVYQAVLEDGQVVVAKFYRPGRWTDEQILEEHTFAAELAAADLPVAAPLPLQPDDPDEHLVVTGADATLGHFRTASGSVYRYAVCPRRAGRAPELESPDTLAWLGRLIGRLHGVGKRYPFKHRRTLDSATYGHASRERLLSTGIVDPMTDGAWVRTSERALQLVDRVIAEVGTVRTLRLHGDCHPGNVLWREEGEPLGPQFVDLDDACNGPAVQDLWMLLPGERTAAESALYHLLDGYRDFADFDDRELRLIEPLRTLRMIHHSAWLAQRWDDPAFPVAFPWFGSPAYWAQQAIELQEQVERLEALD